MRDMNHYLSHFLAKILIFYNYYNYKNIYGRSKNTKMVRSTSKSHKAGCPKFFFKKNLNTI